MIKNFFWKLKDKIGTNRLFFSLIFILFLFIFIFDNKNGFEILKKYLFNIKKLIPILIVVYILIFIFFILIKNKKILFFLKKGNYYKKLFLAVIFGIISSGPIYMWYGLLSNMKKSGLSLGHIASFSYARAIKIPMIPMMILFFDLKYTIIFVIILFVFGFLQSFIIDYFCE